MLSLGTYSRSQVLDTPCWQIDLIHETHIAHVEGPAGMKKATYLASVGEFCIAYRCSECVTLPLSVFRKDFLDAYLWKCNV